MKEATPTKRSRSEARRARLHIYTDDPLALKHAESTAFSQKQLDQLVRNGAKTIWICCDEVTIPQAAENTTFIGINIPRTNGSGPPIVRTNRGGKPDSNVYENVASTKQREQLGRALQPMLMTLLRDTFRTEGTAAVIRSIGDIYREGIGVTKNPAHAVEWYKRAAALGEQGAQWRLVDAYEEGNGVSQNAELAAFWFSMINHDEDELSCEELQELHDEAVAGDAVAQAELAAQYLITCYVAETDEAERHARAALDWYTKAVEQGHVDGNTEFLIGEYCRCGPTKKTPLGEHQSIAWYLSAAEHGSGHAQQFLGSFCITGEHGLRVDLEQAFLWLSRAWECLLDDDESRMSVGHQLGAMREFGIGCEKDEEEGRRWHERASRLDDPRIRYAAGIGRPEALYCMGSVAPPGSTTAVKYLREAAEGGSRMAMRKLASWYACGAGVPQDKKKAAKLLEKAGSTKDLIWELDRI